MATNQLNVSEAVKDVRPERKQPCLKYHCYYELDRPIFRQFCNNCGLPPPEDLTIRLIENNCFLSENYSWSRRCMKCTSILYISYNVCLYVLYCCLVVKSFGPLGRSLSLRRPVFMVSHRCAVPLPMPRRFLHRS